LIFAVFVQAETPEEFAEMILEPLGNAITGHDLNEESSSEVFLTSGYSLVNWEIAFNVILPLMNVGHNYLGR